MASARLPRLRDRLKLGDHGLTVSPFLQGMGDADPDIVGAAYDAGINFFFVSADLHWPLYASMRTGLERLFARGGGIRDRVVVAAASYVVDPGTAVQAYRELLSSVKGLERLDVLFAGMVRPEEMELRLGGLRGVLAHGTFGARAIGASFHERSAAVRAHNERLVDLVCMRSNPRHPGGFTDAFPKLEARSPSRLFLFKSMEGYVSDERWPRLGLSKRHWRPRPPDYYRFALTARQVDGVLMGLGSAAEVKALAAAMRQGRLDPQSRRYLIDLARLATACGAY